jgi:polyhydroxyalkanoate synthase
MSQDARRWSNLLSLWRRPKPVVGATPAVVVHRENKWRLLRYRPRPEGAADATPVLLVPSLINRHYVLDLEPGKSFAEFLVARGHDVFVIDWGTPGDEDRYLTFDDVCDTYLGRAVRIAARHGVQGRAHVLGYCLGGTLAAIHAAARPEHVASLVAVAAPVAFHDDGLLSVWTRTPSFDVNAIVEACGNVPWQLMQGAFHMLRPTLGLSKAVHFLHRAWDDEFLDGFFALETWGNDNVSFPGECFRRYLEELYRGDALVRGTFTLSGRPARLEQITCPVLAVTFEHDNIVPWRSAATLLQRVGAPVRDHIHLPGGHVGAMVSRKAAQTLWPRLSSWWFAQSAALARAAEVHAEPAREAASEQDESRVSRVAPAPRSRKASRRAR